MTPGFYRQGDIPITSVLLSHPIDGPVTLAQDIYFLDRHGIKYWAFEGMPTDGASIPKLAWRIIGTPFGVPGWGRKHPSYLMAALVHDAICGTAEGMERNERWDHRTMGDRKFSEMMEYLGVPGWKIKLMYPAVRAGSATAMLRRPRITPTP